LYVRVACPQLDESLKLLPAVREMETQQADGRWAALPQQERAERSRQAGALQVSLCFLSFTFRLMASPVHVPFSLTCAFLAAPVIPDARDGAHSHHALHLRRGTPHDSLASRLPCMRAG
jgi:hypothetical protein